jgi:MFS family permease
VAAVTAAAGALWPAMAVLIIPGGMAMLVLLRIWRKTGRPASTHSDEPETARDADRPAPPPQRQSAARLPATFWLFACSVGATTAGLVTFGVISYHLAQDRLVPVHTVPLIYAAGMAIQALAALATGALFDRIHGRVLLALPIMVAAVPPLVFANSALIVIIGVLVWGAATGVQDSTVKALVAELVPPIRHATAYGVFAAVQGTAAMAGGALAGGLYQQSLPALVAIVAVSQVVALVLLMATLHRQGSPVSP